MAHDEKRLTDSAAFWVPWGAGAVVIGSVAIGVGIAQANTAAKHSFWANGWFVTGVVVFVIGCLAILWALILRLAHQHAALHWCPDPEAHLLPLAGGASPAELTGNAAAQMRSVMRQLRRDLTKARETVDRAMTAGVFWKMTERLPDETWKKNRKIVEGVAGYASALDALEEAYEHITRLNGSRATRFFSGSEVRASDDMRGAVEEIDRARAWVDSELSLLGD